MPYSVQGTTRDSRFKPLDIVIYRYGFAPVGRILKLSQDSKRYLFQVDHQGYRFTKWVRWTSVRPLTPTAYTAWQQLPLFNNAAQLQDAYL